MDDGLSFKEGPSISSLLKVTNKPRIHTKKFTAGEEQRKEGKNEIWKPINNLHTKRNIGERKKRRGSEFFGKIYWRSHQLQITIEFFEWPVCYRKRVGLFEVLLYTLSLHH